MGDAISADDLSMLADTLRKTMTASSGQALDKELVELGWREMLEEMSDTAIPLVFRLLGETGAHAPVINDVVLIEAGRGAGETVPLPYAGGTWVVWERASVSIALLVPTSHQPNARRPAASGTSSPELTRWIGVSSSTAVVGSSARSQTTHVPPTYGSRTV